MNVLICSQQGERQVEEVSVHLKKMGMNPVLFERYRKDHLISYQYNKKSHGVIRVNKTDYTLNSKTFPVVWYRAKPIIPSEIPGESSKIEEKFCMQEWRIILQSLETFLPTSKWVNAVSCNLIASNKPYQLKLANDLDLLIPQTVITNDAAKALKLFPNSRVIFKTLSSFFTARQVIYTSEVKVEQILENQTEIAMAPGIFQKYIEKKHELRVTLVGEKFFIVKINSQKHPESAIDWRRNPSAELYELGDLSKSTKNKLLSFHRQLGLIYAAYDFIVDRDGNEIFIECNPSGQWLWLENALNLKISHAMAEEFAKSM